VDSRRVLAAAGITDALSNDPLKRRRRARLNCFG
jgi:hypothetical protein